MANVAVFSITDEKGIEVGETYRVINDDGTLGAETSRPPDNAPPARIGFSPQRKWTLEPIHQFDPFQFLAPGETPVFSPNFHLWADFAGQLPFDQRERLGMNGYTLFNTPNDKRSSVEKPDGTLYYFESGIHDQLEGYRLYQTGLEEYERRVVSRSQPLGVGEFSGFVFAVPNVETSLECRPLNQSQGGSFGQGNSFWPDWESIKNNSLGRCEVDGVTRTFQQLYESGLFNQEMTIRRANRFSLLLQILKKISAPGVKVKWGSSMFQGRPRVDFEGNIGTQIDGRCDVSKVGGDGQGNITLNNRAYKLSGTVWDNEDVQQTYWYEFEPILEDGSGSYNGQGSFKRIFLDNDPALRFNYPAIWALMRDENYTALEKGYWQENRRIMKVIRGFTYPQTRQIEIFFEGSVFIPWLAGTIDGGDTPKLDQSPVQHYSRMMFMRFAEGDEYGGGLQIFPPFGPATFWDMATHPSLNKQLHAYTAVIKGRIEMAILETFFPGSILIEDPDVKFNNAGNWINYNGVAAANYNGGSQGQQKPAAMMRYKQTPTGYEVWILFGCSQPYNVSSDHAFRAPGGNALNGCQFICRATGNEATLYGFQVVGSDFNQTYTATPNVDMSKRKRGYPGIILNP